jgi:hypothetical protein
MIWSTISGNNIEGRSSSVDENFQISYPVSKNFIITRKVKKTASKQLCENQLFQCHIPMHLFFELEVN